MSPMVHLSPAVYFWQVVWYLCKMKLPPAPHGAIVRSKGEDTIRNAWARAWYRVSVQQLCFLSDPLSNVPVFTFVLINRCPSLLPDLLQLGGNFYSKDLLTQVRMKTRAVVREVGKRLGPMETGLHKRKPERSSSPWGQRAAFPALRAIHKDC